MTDSLKTVRSRNVVTTAPQTEKAAKGQKRNNAGGFSFTISDLERAKRFLILGSESNYYTPGEKLSAQNAKTLIRLAEGRETSRELVDAIVEISKANRAPKVQPALFALAIAASHGDQESKAYALSKLNDVARTGTHLFTFAGYVEQFRGWGRALKRAIANWYTSKSVDSVAYQAVKYQSREGFSHRDLFRLSHPETQDAAFQGLGEWILRGNVEHVPRVVQGFTLAKQTQGNNPTYIAALVRDYGLSWEMVPTEALNEPKVWAALLDGNVPLGALLRQLPRLTRIGVITPMSAQTADIVRRLTDQEALVKARIHPLGILTALKTYAEGRSFKGDSTWTPVREITDALDKAFYLAFKAVEPSNKRTLLALDVSGSMSAQFGEGVLTSRDVTAAMSLVTAATEPFTHTIGFTGGGRGYGWGYSRSREVSTAGSGQYASAVSVLNISPRQRLDDVVKEISGLPFGSTDCSLPMLYALEQGLEVDTFQVYTDNETYAGRVHPFEALKQYRAATGIPAKLVVLSTQATKFSIADPSDAGMLDIAGFDSSAPALVADFSRGF